MKRTWTALVLSGALICALSVPVMAGGLTHTKSPQIAEETVAQPERYYGQVTDIQRDASGRIQQIQMFSQKSGVYVFHIADETAWIDSGNRAAASPDLAEGDSVYVFHSSGVTHSIPPQSAALAVVTNVPQDAGCAQYHVVEDIIERDGTRLIQTDRGGLLISVDDQTGLSAYHSTAPCTLNDIQAGDAVMAWYDVVLESYPGQTYASHLMRLNQQDGENVPALTRAQFVSMLHEAAGKPVVNYAMSYQDVDPGRADGEAIRWATGEKLISGYADGSFGPEDPITREQAVTILWNWAGRPILMDYTGLSSYQDVGAISPFAFQAMSWAHQKKILPEAGGRLDPQGVVSGDLAERMVDAAAPRS